MGGGETLLPLTLWKAHSLSELTLSRLFHLSKPLGGSPLSGWDGWADHSSDPGKHEEERSNLVHSALHTAPLSYSASLPHSTHYTSLPLSAWAQAASSACLSWNLRWREHSASRENSGLCLFSYPPLLLTPYSYPRRLVEAGGQGRQKAALLLELRGLPAQGGLPCPLPSEQEGGEMGQWEGTLLCLLHSAASL